MIYFLTAVIIILIAVLAVVYIRVSLLLKHLDDMIDSAKNGNFSETNYNEKRLSRLESKMYQYLTAGKTSMRELTSEKDSIKTLVSDISHQTKTPVSNILLYTQLLAESNELNEKDKQLARQIEDQTEKLNFLIASLVKISRLENGIIRLTPKKENVSTLLNNLDFKSQASEKSIALTIGASNNLEAYFDLKWTLEALSKLLTML